MRIPTHIVRVLAACSFLLLTGCALDLSTGSAAERRVTVLYTSDEHGWMEGVSPERGAAQLYSLWTEREGFNPEEPFLILSGGDNWTGPAISTSVAGKSMVEVMNAMHYAASAVGNHEFDFGLDVLQQRSKEANFTYLSANTHRRESGQVPTDAGIDPFTVVEVDSLRIGIIGLTTTSTPTTTNPANVIELEFADYEQALRATVPEVRELDVDWVFVIAHVCLPAMRELAVKVSDLNIQMMGAGHCNDLVAEMIDSTVVLGGGSHLQSYARAEFRYQPSTGAIQRIDYSVHENQSGGTDNTVLAIVQHWQQQAEAILSDVIGYNAVKVERRNPVLEQAIVDSWLQFDPLADVAITNAGGIRAPLPEGNITRGDVVGMMPFENTIITLHLDGATLRQVLAQGTRPLVAGMVWQGDQWRETRSGAALADEKMYRVLVNSFMYAGGDNYQGIAEADPESFDTGINYRQPFLDWIASQHSSTAAPLQLLARP